MILQKVDYHTLSSKQKENYNFQKVAAALADYGFICMWLNDDWQGADFIALHVDGLTHLRVQLKGAGITLNTKYVGKDIYIAFRHDEDYYLYSHDSVLAELKPRFAHTNSWIDNGEQFWGWASIPADLRQYFETFKIDSAHFSTDLTQ